MSTTPVTLNGVTYFVPQPGEAGPTYDQNLTNYLIAIATAFPQTSGTGSGFSVLQSSTVNPATAGNIRLANVDIVDWRNAANSANLALGVGQAGAGGANDLSFGGVQLTGQTFANARVATPQAVTATIAVVNFDAVLNDTEGTITTGAAWKFTVPANKGSSTSVYLVSVALQVVVSGGAANMTMALQHSGTAVSSVFLAAAGAGTFTLADTVPMYGMLAGDTINVSLTVSANTATTQASIPLSNIAIKRMV